MIYWKSKNTAKTPQTMWTLATPTILSHEVSITMANSSFLFLMAMCCSNKGRGEMWFPRLDISLKQEAFKQCGLKINDHTM